MKKEKSYLEEMVEDYEKSYGPNLRGQTLDEKVSHIKQSLSWYEREWLKRFPMPDETSGGMAQWQTNKDLAMQEYLRSLFPIPG